MDSESFPRPGHGTCMELTMVTEPTAGAPGAPGTAGDARGQHERGGGAGAAAWRGRPDRDIHAAGRAGLAPTDGRLTGASQLKASVTTQLEEALANTRSPGIHLQSAHHNEALRHRAAPAEM